MNEKSKKYKLFLTDCDGCLTDGGMYYSEFGDELKKFNTKDGMGFQLLKEKGILTGVITGENCKLNERRFAKLHIDIVRQNISNKLQTIDEICSEYHITREEIVYVGDDVNDIESIRAVGYGCAVNDAVISVKEAAEYITIACGGQGAIREIIDKLIKENKI